MEEIPPSFQKDIVYPIVLGCMKELLRSDLNEKDIEREMERIWVEGMKMNEKIIGYLEIMEGIVATEPDPMYKVRAYKTASTYMKMIQVPIISGKQAQNLPGIGKQIGKKIDEILETGGLKAADESEIYKVMKLFTGIVGVNSRTAKKLYNKGYRRLEDIPLTELNHNQRIGLRYYDELQVRIPRKDISFIEPSLKKIFYEVVERLKSQYINISHDSESLKESKIELAGSYRRELETSGDIDILITNGNPNVTQTQLLEEYINELEKQGIITDRLTGFKKEPIGKGKVKFVSNKGEVKFMGIALLKDRHVRIDIRSISPDEWGTGLLYFTGSKEYNIEMRRHAIRQGLSLSEYNLKKIYTKYGDEENIYKFDTEQGVYDKLGLIYQEPKDRILNVIIRKN